MTRFRMSRWLIAAALATLTAVGPASAGAFANPSRPVCPGPVAAGNARCFAHVITDAHGTPRATATSPTGYGPAQFHGAYGLPASTTASSGQTIAIVDAYDDPTVVSDLNYYSCYYRLADCPTGTKTTSTGAFFKKVNQSGSASGPWPAKNAGWALEIAMDVETAHVICQDCKVLLVEANSSSGADLDAAEDTAVRLGATEISNSWGTNGEYSSEAAENAAHFDHPGIAITVASGDSGYGSFGFPAASPNVVAVGGTHLSVTRNTDGTYSWADETGWGSSGSGCSLVFGAQSWQTSASGWSATGCDPARGVADVAADADPNTGAAVYDTTRYQGRTGWFQVGGTSLSSPLVAAVYALAGNASSVSYPASIPYANTGSLHDVTSGPATGSCGTTICAPAAGYDGPTGVGSPNGLGGF